jgi:hypothetical protein
VSRSGAVPGGSITVVVGSPLAGCQPDCTLPVGVAPIGDRHQQVTERRELVIKGRRVSCSTCCVTWPCEVGQALAIIVALVRG